MLYIDYTSRNLRGKKDLIKETLIQNKCQIKILVKILVKYLEVIILKMKIFNVPCITCPVQQSFITNIPDAEKFHSFVLTSVKFRVCQKASLKLSVRLHIASCKLLFFLFTTNYFVCLLWFWFCFEIPLLLFQLLD